MLTGNACSGGNFVFTVKVDGTIQPCPFVDDIPLGTLKDGSIWKIFKNRFKNTQLKLFKDPPEECRRCTYVSVCSGGCKAGNKEVFGRYDCKDIRCLGPFPDKLDEEEVLNRVPAFF
ncbi:MAG TPA: SPASM domain-containing protein [Firmicutes bacterium]|nr:SPASM domain-containing protein [Bacillota bacterium]